MKKKPSKRNKWEDHYSRRAKKEQYPARSVYKLQEIQRRERLLKKGHKVLDLGCSPGSWLMYAAETVGKTGLVVGIDLKPVSIDLPANAKVYVYDLLAPGEDFFRIEGGGFNAVLSDMAPATTGNKRVDAIRSFQLCDAALAVADRMLRPGGAFVCKIFQGEDFKAFSDAVKSRFAKHRIFKPESSRKGSKEIFVIGTGKQAEKDPK